MFVTKFGKRKRLVQTTLDGILKRPRHWRNKESTSLLMEDVTEGVSTGEVDKTSTEGKIEKEKDERLVEEENEQEKVDDILLEGRGKEGIVNKSSETTVETKSEEEHADNEKLSNEIHQERGKEKIVEEKLLQSTIEAEIESQGQTSESSVETQQGETAVPFKPELEKRTDDRTFLEIKETEDNIFLGSNEEVIADDNTSVQENTAVNTEDGSEKQSSESNKDNQEMAENKVPEQSDECIVESSENNFGSNEEELKDTSFESNVGSQDNDTDASSETSIAATKVEEIDKSFESNMDEMKRKHDEEASGTLPVETKKESDDDTQDYVIVDDSNEEPVRLGVDYEALLRIPDCSGPTPTLTPSQSHTILFKPYHLSQPYPSTYRDKWDRNHVRMPCSKENLYPAKDKEKHLLSRWELIRSSLKRSMTSSYDLQEAILSYNAHYEKRWNFRLLHIFLIENISQEENKEFFEFILPGIIQLALSLPEICTQAPPLLKRDQEHTITMTQQQAACLLANAFLCTFPRRNAGVRNTDHEFGNYPDINFNRLFQLGENRQSQKKIEKLKCILHYFKRVLQRPASGSISFKRQVLKSDEVPKWHSSNTKLCRLRVSSDGTIEDNAPGMLQVDFANKFVGGGVLGEGCVQEEIRFIICPELILARLFTERLENNECLVVTGAERFSDYVGYARTFQWAGNHADDTSRDSWGRLNTEILAIDAKPRMSFSEQYSPANLKRELEKAFCGFLSRNSAPENLPAVATGKWGCGAFNGDPQLKSLIQIMAASVARRDVMYFTFDDKTHAEELHEIHSLLEDRDIRIGDLWRILNDFKRQISAEPPIRCDLFTYIRQVLRTSNQYDDDTVTNNEGRPSPLLFDDKHYQ